MGSAICNRKSAIINLTLILLLLSALCVACQGITLPLSLAAPGPLPTPVPPSAERAARAFLQAWEQGEYSAMHALLTPSSRAATSEEEFIAAYSSAAQAMTLTRLTTSLQSVLQGEEEARADFRVTAQTLLLGPLSVTNTLTLQLGEGCWGVVWSPACILPQLGGGRHLYLLPDVAARGNIYDRKGLGLATNGCRVVVGIVPEKLKEEHTLPLLSQVLEEPVATLRERYADVPPHWFVALGEVSADKGVEYYDALKGQPGVVLKERPVRVYCGGDLAPHVLGYVGLIKAEDAKRWADRGYPPDIVVGQTGLEAWGEEYLRGEWGGTLALVSLQGQAIATLARKPAHQSRSIYTTLDRALQQRAVELLKGKRGAVVALDPHSGQVLAMASSPSFDLNLFAPAIAPQDWQALLSTPGQPLLNRATQGLYPPASVFKIVSMAAVMEAGLYDATSSFNCTGLWNGLGPGWTRRCWVWPRQHGTLDLVTGLVVSCNTVFYEVGLALHQRDPAILPQYARYFGLGQPTGVQGLPVPWTSDGLAGHQPSSGDEEGGLVPDEEWKGQRWGEAWTAGDSVNMAIGQGYLLVTPIQMAVLISAVANGGILYQPQLVWKIGGTPELPEQFLAPEIRGSLPVTPEHLAAIREGLWGVANRDAGTAAWVFKDFETPVAGKTGTAENPGDSPHAWFVGYAPADDPQIAIAVVVENSGEGSVAAAPIFRSLVEVFLQKEDDDASHSRK